VPRSARPAGLIDTGAILALLDLDDQWHEACVEAYHNHRLPWLTTEAVLTEALHLVLRNLRDDRGLWRLFRSGAIQMSHPHRCTRCFPSLKSVNTKGFFSTCASTSCAKRLT
jgi:predicted nucleic acid-binding protein